MPKNLNAHSKPTTHARPHQKGQVIGRNARGREVQSDVEWLIDTGAEISAVNWDTANQFALNKESVIASGTTGARILVYSGVTTVIWVLDASDTPQAVRCDLPIAVRENNAGSEIIGVDRLEACRAAIMWDPVRKVGRLYQV